MIIDLASGLAGAGTTAVVALVVNKVFSMIATKSEKIDHSIDKAAMQEFVQAQIAIMEKNCQILRDGCVGKAAAIKFDSAIGALEQKLDKVHARIDDVMTILLEKK